MSSTAAPSMLHVPAAVATVFPGQFPVCWCKPVSALKSELSQRSGSPPAQNGMSPPLRFRLMRQADEHGGAVPGAERDHRSANFVGRRITEHAAEEASYSRALREAEIEKAAA